MDELICQEEYAAAFNELSQVTNLDDCHLFFAWFNQQ